MVITERLKNPIYQKVNDWLTEIGSTVNVFEMEEKEAFYFAMQMEFPGINVAMTNTFFDIAEQLMR